MPDYLCLMRAACMHVGDIGTGVTPGKNGFLVPKRNSATLAKTINSVFSLSEEDVRLIGNRARKTVEKSFCARFSVKTIVKAIEQTRARDAGS